MYCVHLIPLSFLPLQHLYSCDSTLSLTKGLTATLHRMFWDPKIQLVPTLLSSKMKGKRAFHILAPLASFGSPVPPIGPIQPPVGNQHPPYGAAYGWRYPPGLRLCFNSHDHHGSIAETDDHNSFH